MHCLAGAHRAGTAGVLILMRMGNMDKQSAIRLAKKLRPAINPIGGLDQLLNHYNNERT